MLKYTKSIPFNMIHVCIDQYDHFQMKGCAYNNTLESPVEFSDIHEIILRFEEVFNKNGNPLSSYSSRSFVKQEEPGRYQNKPEVLYDYDVIAQHRGKIVDFDIVVQSRRPATWQGVLFFDNKEIVFHDVLEMIKIIDKKIDEVLRKS